MSIWKELRDRGYIKVDKKGKPSYTRKGRSWVRGHTRERLAKGEISKKEAQETLRKIDAATQPVKQLAAVSMAVIPAQSKIIKAQQSLAGKLVKPVDTTGWTKQDLYNYARVHGGATTDPKSVYEKSYQQWKTADVAKPLTLLPEFSVQAGEFTVLAGTAVKDTDTGKVIGYIGANNQLMDLHGTVIGYYEGDRKDADKVYLAEFRPVPKREGIPYCEDKNYEKAKKYLIDLMGKGEVPGGSVLIQRHNEWVYIPPRPENETMKLGTGEWVFKQSYDQLDKDAQHYLNKYGVANFTKSYVAAQQWVASEVQAAVESIRPYEIKPTLPKGVTNPAFVKYVQSLPVGYDLPAAVNDGVSDKNIKMLFGEEALAEAKERAKLYATKVPELPAPGESQIKYLTSGGYAAFMVKDAPPHKKVAGKGAWIPWLSQSAAINYGIATKFDKHLAEFNDKWKPFVGKDKDGNDTWLGSREQLDQYTCEVQMLQQQAGNLTLEAGMILSAMQSPKEFGLGLIPIYGTIRNWGGLTKKGQAVSVIGDILMVLPVVGLAVKAVRFPTVKVPVKNGTVTVWRGMSIKGKPTFGISKSRLTLGERGIKYPKITEVELGYEPVSKIETSVMATRNALRKMGVSETQINRLFKTLEERAKMGGRESPSLDPDAMFDATKTLNARSVAELLETAMGMGDKIEQVYGSTTIRAQLLPKLSKIFRKSADIDMQTRMPVEETVKFAQDLVKRLKTTEGHQNIRISKDHPTLIEIKVKGKWHHAIDIHCLGEASRSELATAEGAYGMLHAEKVISIEYPGQGTLRIMRLAESGKRKAQSILRWQEGEFGPYQWRGKDIGDFYVILWTFEGEGAANAWAKAWGYTPSKVMAMVQQNPPKLVGWQWTPQPGKVPKGATPRVKLLLPSSMAKALKAKSPSAYRTIIKSMPYTSSLPLISKISALPKSISSSVPRSISTRTSTSLPSSPAVSPSVKVSPSISPSPSPSGSPSPSISGVPSPAPSPSPYPTSIPVPTPIPGAKGIPKKAIVPLKDRVSHLTKKQRSGIIAWKQGWCYKLIYPPYGVDNIINSRKPLSDVKYLSGPHSARRSIIAKHGYVPPEVLRDMGIMDVIIRTPWQKKSKPKIFYKRDIHQRTKITPSISGVR